MRGVIIFYKHMIKIKRNSKGQFVKGENTCENNYSWKGDDVGYYGIHCWLIRTYGKANKCEHPDCKKISNKYHWSLLKGKKYQRKRNNFWKLCSSCHVLYDITDETKFKLSKAHLGKFPPNTRYYTFKDKTLPLREWSIILNIKHRTLRARINQYKWSITKTLTTPIN